MSKYRHALPVALAALFVAGCDRTLFDYATNAGNIGICGIIVLVLDVIALVEILGSDRALANKVLWAIFIVCVPVLSLIVYYLFARGD